MFLSEIDWDYLWQRHQIFATEYAQRGHETTYFNKFGMRMPKISEIPYVLRRLLASMEHSSSKNDGKNSTIVTVASPIFIPESVFGAKWINKYILIPKFFRCYTSPNEKLIVHVYQPTILTRDIVIYLKKHCMEVRVIYDCVQNYDYHPARTSNTKQLETNLLHSADVVIADSDFLYSKHVKIRPDMIQVPPGVDFDYFHSCFRGDEVEKAKAFCFYGHLRQDNDIDLINNLAERDGYTMTVIGKVDISVVDKVSKKIELVPPVAYHELAAYLVKADVLVLPYVVNEFTKGIVPAKFMECLASEKPVIATELPAFRGYEDIVTIVDSSGYFKELVYKPEKQVSIARSSSWQTRFDSFYQPLIKEK
nr:putative glycosyltransferase [Vibrio mimicus]